MLNHQRWCSTISTPLRAGQLKANCLSVSISVHCFTKVPRMPKDLYTLSGPPVASDNECTDTVIARSGTFTYSNHFHAVAMRASRLASMVMKIFSTRDVKFLKKNFLCIHKTHIRVGICSPETVLLGCRVTCTSNKC